MDCAETKVFSRIFLHAVCVCVYCLQLCPLSFIFVTHIEYRASWGKRLVSKVALNLPLDL